MKRSILKSLELWKSSPGRKPLIIRGARQVGKTWVMKAFGQAHFDKVAYVSFVDMPSAHKIFDADYDLSSILAGLSAISHTAITPGDTLIILDEIQECERALNALKFFHENAPDYHVIAAGSLLGVAVRHRQFSFPVGQVDYLNLYPMGFCEFLEALGENQIAKLILEQNWSTLKILEDTCVRLLKDYLFVGGMPEVVRAFSEHRDYDEVRRIQNAILTGYEADFSKYTAPAFVPRIAAVWNSIPAQLAKENKKFMFKDVAKGARAREYETALEWLTLTGLVYKVHRISKPDLPISSYEESAFKLFTIDCGLLCAKAMLDSQTIVEGNQIFTEFKGSLAEQYVFQTLRLKDDLTIAYWGSEKGQAEVDFVIQHQNEIIPIEVKAARNLHAKSLAVYRQKYQPKTAIRTSLAYFEENTGLVNVPLYMLEGYLGS